MARRTKRTARTLTLSEQLRAAIAESGQSLQQLAQESGVDVAALSRFVRGERTLTMTTADRLAAYLKLQVTSAKGKV